jgi:tetraacyldisaccharide 4'-kinase
MVQFIIFVAFLPLPRLFISFKPIMKKSVFRLLAGIFGAITRLRNTWYDQGILSSTYFTKPVTLVIGNLAVGGTGKSPFVHYLVSHWKFSGNYGILSRGYGRKTTGFRWVDADSTASQVGDEPLAYKRQFTDLPIAVCENRVRGVEQMNNLDAIILDDAFQHRALKADVSLICTTFAKPFYADQLMPLGSLRESVDGLTRAQAIIVNRCPNELSEAQKEPFLRFNLPVFFTRVVYGVPVGNSAQNISKWHIFAGIADPLPFFKEANNLGEILEQQTYADHYAFQETDYRYWEHVAANLDKSSAILTTHKDYVRMDEHLHHYPALNSRLFYLPMQMEFIDQEAEFWAWLTSQVPLNLKN